MDIFEKCERFTLADQLRNEGIYPYFHALETRQDVEVIMEGKRRIMLGSNNYLGLTTEPTVVEAGIKALEKYGSGCSGSRFLNGTLRMHLELESELAAFVNMEEAVTFSTGFQSNLGIISAIVGRNDYVVCDRENHASIYDGCQLSFGKMVRYKHNDMEDLERILKKIPEIVECHFVTGKAALLVKVYCFDNDHLMEILLNTMQKIPYIQSTETMISLDQAIERQVWVKDYKNTSYQETNEK